MPGDDADLSTFTIAIAIVVARYLCGSGDGGIVFGIRGRGGTAVIVALGGRRGLGVHEVSDFDVHGVVVVDIVVVVVDNGGSGDVSFFPAGGGCCCCCCCCFGTGGI